MMVRLLALEVARTAESMALAARELSSRRVSKGQLSRTLQQMHEEMKTLAPLISSLTDQAQDRLNPNRHTDSTSSGVVRVDRDRS
jgi:hypothetical protein